MKTVAFIPVRIGSKSIPKKNIKEFCGRPLIHWVLEAALSSSFIDEVIVASDSSEIDESLNHISSTKLSIFKRSKESATDTASTEFVMLEFLTSKGLSSDTRFILIQATSPFLKQEHLDSALKLFEENQFDSMLSVVRMKRFLWSENGEPKNYDFNNRPRRQDFNGELVENGAFYISKVGAILETKNRLSGEIGLFEMPEDSFIEIDEEDDWLLAENLMKRNLPSRIGNKKIRLVISDVDGVLTDAGMYYSERGDELKKFNTRDGMGFQLLREAGYKTAIITSENTELVEKRATKLKVDSLYQGKREKGKLQAAIEIGESFGIELEEIAYIGDDINCMELLSNVGLAACPSDAVTHIKGIPGILILSLNGGCGVFREFADLILSNKV